MKLGTSLLIAAAVVCSISIAPAFAKTAKECTEEWRAEKASMQARHVTQKAYVEQCRSRTEPTASSQAATPAETAPSPVRGQATSAGTKTVKECIAEWRADKAGMQARGVTQKAFVEQCRSAGTPAASSSPPRPSAATPPAVPILPSSASSSHKTTKECTAEWRADKAGMQTRGVLERVYVEQCRAGAMPSAIAPPPNPTPATPSPEQLEPTATRNAPASAPQKRAPITTAAPVPTPTQLPSNPGDQPTLEAGQFADEASAKARCPSDAVVWVNLPTKVYHFAGTKSYGTTKRGAFMCEKEAIAAEDHAAKNEKHP